MHIWRRLAAEPVEHLRVDDHAYADSRPETKPIKVEAMFNLPPGWKDEPALLDTQIFVETLEPTLPTTLTKAYYLPANRIAPRDSRNLLHPPVFHVELSAPNGRVPRALGVRLRSGGRTYRIPEHSARFHEVSGGTGHAYPPPLAPVARYSQNPEDRGSTASTTTGAGTRSFRRTSTPGRDRCAAR